MSAPGRAPRVRSGGRKLRVAQHAPAVTLSTALVHFRCRNRQHRSSLVPAPTLTLHKTRWAYCPGGGHPPDHEWTEIQGGMTYEALRVNSVPIRRHSAV